MKYIALKPCKFGGKDYQKSDVVPGELIDQSRMNSLKRMGIIAAVDEPAAEPKPVVGKKVRGK